MNRENQQWLLEQNKELQAEQRLYDHPEAHKKRFIEAGLNPNLIYGNGSQAGMAFPIDAGGLPPARIDSPDATVSNPVAPFIAASQGVANVGMQQARMQESAIRRQALAIQNEIAKTNPMLNPDVALAVTSEMIATADYKRMVAWKWTDVPAGQNRQALIWEKIEREIQLEMQRLGLNTTDQEIKNKILESKEFENVVKELNAKWLSDSNVTPEHIRQGLMLILSKMLH